MVIMGMMMAADATKLRESSIQEGQVSTASGTTRHMCSTTLNGPHPLEGDTLSKQIAS